MRRNPTVQGDLSTHIQKRRELGAEANQKVLQIVPFFPGNPLLARMRETAACFFARLREQGDGIASYVFGKTTSSTARAQ